MLTFDPRKKEVLLPEGVETLSYKDLERKAITLQRELIEERKRAGEKNPEAVPVISRRTNEVRWFNLSPNYQGSLQLAESLLVGKWRLASKEEEAAAIQEQADAKQKTVQAAASKVAMQHAAALAGAMAAQHFNAPAPVAPVAQPVQPIPQSAEAAKPKNSK